MGRVKLKLRKMAFRILESMGEEALSSIDEGTRQQLTTEDIGKIGRLESQKSVRRSSTVSNELLRDKLKYYDIFAEACMQDGELLYDSGGRLEFQNLVDIIEGVEELTDPDGPYIQMVRPAACPSAPARAGGVAAALALPSLFRRSWRAASSSSSRR